MCASMCLKVNDLMGQRGVLMQVRAGAGFRGPPLAAGRKRVRAAGTAKSGERVRLP